MHDAMTQAAEALSPMLSALSHFTEQRLDSVWEMHTEGSLDHLELILGTTALIIAADPDDDTIHFSVSDPGSPGATGYVEASQAEPWKSLIGRSFGWGWVTINQQGYCDGLLLSFDGIYPEVLLNVIASSIKVGVITVIATVRTA